MITLPGLRLVDEEPVEPPAQPAVLVRTIQAPPGLPWEQSRAADLEARHSSPLPLGEVIFELRRLEAWRPGQPGRFGAFYVLSREVVTRLDAKVEVDGRLLALTFLSPGLQRQRGRRLGMVAGGAAVLALVITASLGAAIARRTDADETLSALETRSAAKLRALEARQRIRVQNRALDAQADRNASLHTAIADLAWVASEKRPDAHVEAVHWRPGLVALEVRGSQAPLQVTEGRRLQKSAKPIRRDVWLWGVTDGSIAPVVSRPITAMPLDETGARR